ncbi:hypothetical protein [Embleya sp. NPDC020630]|uniref:hypothetical protein n=1 Tax=Embleya sp. NPDC020630 TaxID=3363979 RepID=UPI00379C8373
MSTGRMSRVIVVASGALMVATLAGCGGSSSDHKTAGATATPPQPPAAVATATSAGTSGGTTTGGSGEGTGVPTARPPAASASAGGGPGGNATFCADAVKTMATDDKLHNGLPDAQTILVWDRMNNEAPAAIKGSVDNVDRQFHQRVEHGTMDDIGGFAVAYQSVLEWVAGNCGLTRS